jgi:hypothetical protein
LSWTASEALDRVSYLPPHRIPSRCQHTNILKTILVNCRDLSFTTYYPHIKAHQDDHTSFQNLSRKAQLNCICNHAEKFCIATDGTKQPESEKMFPLKPMGVFIQGEKMTSDTGGHIRYWAHHQLALAYYHEHNLLSHQFDAIDWRSVHNTLHKLPWLFQLWASKQVLGIAGTMKFLLYQDGRSPLCPSCLESNKTCKHIASCPEAVRAAAFRQSTNKVKKWMENNGTYPDVKLLLLQYLRGYGLTTCLECASSLNLPPILCKYATSQDVIGWDNFVMGMIPRTLLAIKSTHFHTTGKSSCATQWIVGLITHLLQITHTQWIYRCVLVQDCSTGVLISSHKAELLKEIEHQVALGPEELAEEDQFLLECNLGEIASTTGKLQGYWLLGIQVARKESCLRTEARDESHSRPRKCQRWA